VIIQCKCCLCGAELERNSVGLNKKLLGRKIEQFYCMPCLANNLEVTVEDLLVKIEEFKRQGCRLFL